MYENIRKPGLLKNIPMVFIRALPALYYYCAYHKKQATQKTSAYFKSNLDYINAILLKTGALLKIEDFKKLADEIKQLDKIKSDDRLKYLENTTVSLSQICYEYRKVLKEKIRENKNEYIDKYRKIVIPLNILITGTDHPVEKMEKLAGTLSEFCYYNVEKALPEDQDFTPKLVMSDFAILINIDSPQVHDLVMSFNNAHVPCCAIVHIEKGNLVNTQTIRHASQLRKNGVEVLFKITTPIRLFTSIDKTFMKYHLEA